MPSSLEFQASLDRFLERRGEPMYLSRLHLANLPVLGFRRDYGPDELVEGSGIVQGDSMIIISSTALVGWSGISPRVNDAIIISIPTGARRVIQNVGVRPMGTGFNLSVRG